MSRASKRIRFVLAMTFAAFALVACDGCHKKDEKKSEPPKRLPTEECVSASDCADDNPCTEKDCRDARCVFGNVPAGTSCDNDNVCDGISKCDGKGKCKTSPPPDVDDGNPCTTDSCDAVRGPLHEPVAIDDFDACTKDSCDPRTGEVKHEPIELDDGNDCTFDSCDPKTGVKHQQPNPIYSCESCGQGFHAASRTASRQCSSPTALQSFCVPDCGASFYSCETACPKGYQEKSRAANPQCGSRESLMLFCLRA